MFDVCGSGQHFNMLFIFVWEPQVEKFTLDDGYTGSCAVWATSIEDKCTDSSKRPNDNFVGIKKYKKSIWYKIKRLGINSLSQNNESRSQLVNVIKISSFESNSFVVAIFSKLGERKLAVYLILLPKFFFWFILSQIRIWMDAKHRTPNTELRTISILIF